MKPKAGMANGKPGLWLSPEATTSKTLGQGGQGAGDALWSLNGEALCQSLLVVSSFPLFQFLSSFSGSYG